MFGVSKGPEDPAHLPVDHTKHATNMRFLGPDVQDTSLDL